MSFASNNEREDQALDALIVAAFRQDPSEDDALLDINGPEPVLSEEDERPWRHWGLICRRGSPTAGDHRPGIKPMKRSSMNLSCLSPAQCTGAVRRAIFRTGLAMKSSGGFGILRLPGQGRHRGPRWRACRGRRASERAGRDRA